MSRERRPPEDPGEPGRRVENEPLTDEELEGQEPIPLPFREAMSVIDASVAIPLDPKLAADVLAGEIGHEPGEEPQSQSSTETASADDEAGERPPAEDER
jgi:hypothetical protein